MKKFKISIISALLFVGILAFSGVVYPWGAATGDGSRANAIRETAVFFNNSGGTIAQGSIVIVDTRATETGTAAGGDLQQAVTAGTTMGSYITTTSTADASGVVGVVLGGTAGSVDCGNQSACIVVTKGPVDTLILDVTDAVSAGDVIATSTTAGFGGKFDGTCNGQSNTCVVGNILENGDGDDIGKAIVYIKPQ